MAAPKKLATSQKLEAITETSCLVNVMHEILVNCWKNRTPSIAVCPTQYLEQKLGYDVALPYFEKVLALQFKAYYRRNYKALDYFKICQSQQKTLLKYPQNTAFYVFPDYGTHAQMHNDKHAELSGQYYKILNNTWFVEVNSIPAGTTRVLKNQLVKGSVPSLNWSNLSKMIATCEIGFRITKINGRYELLDPEERIVEMIQVPSGTFALFYMELRHAKPKQNSKVKVTFNRIVR
jgi:hypothetical protein